MSCKYLSLISISLLVISSCVDRLDMEPNAFDPDNDQIVIDGFISDQPGPYYVRIFRPSAVDDVLNARSWVNAKQVSIFDDEGNQEILLGKQGFYYTDPSGIRGKVGHKYWLEIQLLDGRIFKSVPEEIQPPGFIDSIYFEFDSYKPLKGPTEFFLRYLLMQQQALTPTSAGGIQGYTI